MNRLAARSVFIRRGIGRGMALLAIATAGSVLPVFAAASAEPAASPAPAAAAPSAMQVTGFRDAHWGMTAAEVKAAIRKDFNIPPEKVQIGQNLSERTTILSVTVPSLIEGAGAARISYILGYSTKKLIQVSVVWGTPLDPHVKPDEIVAAANQLRELLVRSGYQPGTVHTNVASSAGSILVFEGQDADKHTTLLQLANGTVPGRLKNGKRKAVATIVLQLSYSLDAEHPDIFRLKKGEF